MSDVLCVLFCDDSGGAVRGFLNEVVAPLRAHITARTVASLEGFRALAGSESFDVVISDLNFEQVGGGPKDGLLILQEAGRRWPDAERILLTAHAGSLEASEALQLGRSGLGAQDLFGKTEGDDPRAVWARLRERLLGVLQSRRGLLERVAELERAAFFHRQKALDDALAALSRAPVAETAARIRSDPERCRHGIVAHSFALREVLARLERAARRQSDVLLLGETGTGKELLARALHAASPRCHAPLVKTDLAALGRELVAAELFGHARGAFTGAVAARRGLVREADGGMLFFDEIGNLAADVQASLLRLLQDRTFRPLGADKDERVDTVVVTATHVDLEQAVAAGAFRADLLERLSVVVLRLPPLRERREDIPLLAVCFLDELRRRFDVPGFSRVEAGALERLARHPWPRNVRQLRNTVERLFSAFDDDLDPITAAHVEAVLPDAPGPDAPASLSEQVLAGRSPLTLAQLARQHGEDAAREVIRDTFRALGGPPDDAQAAALFGGMKANAWRQFAFKRGLTNRAVQAGDP